jgi:hypothetical protein
MIPRATFLFAGFSLLSALTLLRGQVAAPEWGFDASTLSRLSTSLVGDLQVGTIEWAQIHVTQINMACFGMIQTARSEAVQDGAAVRSSGEVALLRSRFLNALKMRPPGFVPPDPSATASLIPVAQELEMAAEARNFDLAEADATRLRDAIAKLAAQRSREHLNGTIENISDPTIRAYFTLSVQLADALTADDVHTAEVLAPEVLRQTESLKSTLPSELIGRNIYNAYDALGRSAVERGDYEAAKQCLLQAATTPGTANMAGWGPNLKLAKALLDKGYGDTVVMFLTACKSFWNKPIVDQWIVQIKSGQHPTFAPNIGRPS